jgi:SPP1 gp7 family putative phage head morphogenesis protein
MYLQRHSSSVAKKIVALLNRMDDKIVKRLETEDFTKLSKYRQEKLLERIREIVKSHYGPVISDLKKEVSSLAVYEAGFQVDVFKKVVPVAIDFITPSKEQLSAAVKSRPFNGRLLKEWYSGVEAGAFGRLRDAIRTGYTEGQTTEQVVRIIRGTRKQKYTDGILQQGRRAAVAAVRTSLNHTANVARGTTYNENSDIIKGVQWVATLDGKTTRICASRDGKVYPVDKGPRPPAHINCRSSTAPVLKSWKELGIKLPDAPEGTRASMSGQVPASTTYEEFLRKQPNSFQDEFLGQKAGILFRRGKLPLSKFVDKAGNDLTLDQLRVAESEAWAKAGL